MMEHGGRIVFFLFPLSLAAMALGLQIGRLLVPPAAAFLKVQPCWNCCKTHIYPSKTWSTSLMFAN